MARKVKQYLSNLTLETNEESLQTLSIQCEPSISTREPLFTILKLDHHTVLIHYGSHLDIHTTLLNLVSHLTVPKSSGDRKRPDTSPVVARAALHPRQQLQKSNQALQVPTVALYPSRKKVPVKDLPPFGKPFTHN